MIQINTLLELRSKIKNKKPDFIRQDTHKRNRLSIKWRKPKGIHSKIRHHFKGHRKIPSPGYKSPIKVKSLHTSGLKIINVCSAEDILKINRETEGIIISKTVGKRKRLEILKKAKELNIDILNLNIDKVIKNIEDFVNSKKKTDTTQKEKTKEKVTNVKESKQITKLSEEQRKDLDKKEKDQILTRKM